MRNFCNLCVFLILYYLARSANLPEGLSIFQFVLVAFLFTLCANTFCFICIVDKFAHMVVNQCSVDFVNGNGHRGVSTPYSNLLESAKTLCAEVLKSQQENSGYSSLRKSIACDLPLHASALPFFSVEKA